MLSHALGLIETRGLIGAIEATDAAAKAAAVVIASAELTDAAFMTVKIEGELGAVQAAVEAGAQAAAKIGELIAAHVIPRPAEGLRAITPDRRYVSKYHDREERPALPFDESDRQSVKIDRHGPVKQAVAPEPTGSKTTPRTSMPPVHPVARPQRETPPPPVAEPTRARAPETPAVPSRAELEAMPVVALRQFARGLANLPIQGRQISMANRQQLLDAIAAILPLK